MKLTRLLLLLTLCIAHMGAWCHSYDAPFYHFCNTITGAIKITVHNENKNPLPLATVKILNTSYTALTNSQGEVYFPKLAGGRYEATISMTGYSVAYIQFEVVDDREIPITLTLKESVKTLDEVVINAERNDKNVLRTPVSSTVINSKKVKEGRIWQIDDLSAIAPNFNISPSGGGFYSMTVRGISAYSKVPAVISYIDDVPVFNGYVMGYNLNDIAQIEMLRGPQGTLFGRGASGGVLLINSKKPANYATGFAEASYGNNNQQRYNAGVHTPLIKDKLFIAASGLYNHINGFFTNTYDNTRLGDETAVGGHVKLLFQPNERWAFNYQLRGERTMQKGTYLLGLNKEDAINNPYRTNVDKAGSSKRYFLSHALVVNYYGKKINVKSVTAHQGVGAFYKDWELDGTPQDRTYYFTPTNTPSRYFTQEIKFSNVNNNDKINWQAGLFYLKGKDVDDLTYHYGKAADSLNIGAPQKIAPPYENETHSTTQTNSYAVFGQVSYTVLARTELQAGLRYEYEEQKLSTSTDLLLPGQPAIPVIAITHKQTHFKALSPKFSLLHRINDNASVYFSYARGNRPGGVNPYSSEEKYLSFKPEFSNNFEVGYKVKSNRNNLRLQLSAFLIQLKDQQIYTVTSGLNFATLNVGTIVSKGVEAELSYIPAKGLQIDWNAGYTDAKYTALPYFIVNQQGQPQQQDLKNNKPLQAPKVTSFFAATYSVPTGAQSSCSIRGEWKYSGDQFFDYANTIEQKAYSLFHARAAFNYKKIELALWGRNIADKRYLSYAYPFMLLNARVAQPRTYGATLSVRF